MNLSIAIIGARKAFCDECNFLASVQIRQETTMNSPIQLCTKHAEELKDKLELCILEIKHG